jgi:hypothetical protein
MRYIQFQKYSTGYIEGSIPPKYSNEHIKLIDAVGSDRVFKLDGRKSLETQIIVGKKLTKKRKFISFKIIEATNFLDKGKIVYDAKIVTP